MAAVDAMAAVDPAVLGPLARYVEPGVTDLLVDAAGALWRDAGAGPALVAGWLAPGEHALRQLAVRLVALGGRHLDEASPCVDARLGGGIRVHAVLPPISTGGTLLSIRLPAVESPTLGVLAADGGMPPAVLGLLRRAVVDRRNLLITGAAGAGKTTLLAALLGEVPAQQRIVTIEDVAELRIAHPHTVGLQVRQPNLEGAGGIGLAELLRQALRMRPDRIVLGECRGAELRELLGALNTGHAGSAGTLHANGLGEVPARLLALGALAGLSASALAWQAAAAFDLVVHLGRGADGRRAVTGIARMRRGSRGLRLVELPPDAPGAGLGAPAAES